jgi:hypothetical protein
VTPHPSENSHPSPSLATSAGPGAPRLPPAFELKFLVDAALALQVQSWAAQTLRLQPDSHADATGAYATTSLYLDTPQLDVYHRSPSFRRRKFRVRRYAMTPWVFLERKTKSNDRVSKRRSSVGEDELGSLALPMSLETWPGNWFHRRVVVKGLRPACRIAYRRTALVGTCAEGPLRVTLDREVRGVLSDDWRLLPFEGGVPLLTDRVILELKFLRALPLPFKQLVSEFRLEPAPVSKYRLCREAYGIAAPASSRPATSSEAARA